MTREVYDKWKAPMNTYNKSTPFYVRCDCGELATKVYQHSYFDCPECGRRYGLNLGQYVELKK